MRAYGMNESRAFDPVHDGGPPSKHWKNHSRSKKAQRRGLHKRARRAAKIEIEKETRFV